MRAGTPSLPPLAAAQVRARRPARARTGTCRRTWTREAGDLAIAALDGPGLAAVTGVVEVHRACVPLRGREEVHAQAVGGLRACAMGRITDRQEAPTARRWRSSRGTRVGRRVAMHMQYGGGGLAGFSALTLGGAPLDAPCAGAGLPPRRPGAAVGTTLFNGSMPLGLKWRLEGNFALMNVSVFSIPSLECRVISAILSNTLGERAGAPFEARANSARRDSARKSGPVLAATPCIAMSTSATVSAAART
jgi:hypothetical protein